MNRDGLTRRPAFGRAALCVSCKATTLAPVAVRYIESGNGLGTTLWACPTHAPNLTPGPLPGELEPNAYPSPAEPRSATCPADPAR